MFTEEQYLRWDSFFKQFPICSKLLISYDECLPDPEIMDIKVTYLYIFHKFLTQFIFRECAQSASALQVRRKHIFSVAISSMITASTYGY